MKTWKSYKYKNLTVFMLSIIFAIFVSRFEAFHSFLLNLGGLGYIGAFFAGVLFTSSFTIATGAVILLVLAERLSPLELGIIAGMGGVIGDLTIFHIIKDGLLQEITPIYDRLGGKHLSAVLHTKYFSWTLPLIGGLIIASPFPDELGVSLLGISKIQLYKFILISFAFNALGIFLIISASNIIKP